ncbi:helix-turn-helix domain-containing protein [Roseibium sp.]|uniref:helix-turn-helix domain-containing protein n=1 Tax=Roseibium sp. TaxID=1936156 RepID=UPI003D12B875
MGGFFFGAFDFDLLGDPIPEGFGKRGRPPHLPTEEKRKLVIQLCAFQWPVDKIAAALGITAPTLRKNYFRELKAKAEARCRVEAKLLSALMGEVEKGNVSAIDKYMKRLERHDRLIAAEAIANRGQAAGVLAAGAQSVGAAGGKLGKKEAARRAAGDYTGIFAPPDGPVLQ